MSALLAFDPFASWAMLGWAAAAIAPIVIHLWSRRRYQHVVWAAMDYLLAAMKKNARRVRLENLLLLAVRVCILLLLAVTLARPGCSGDASNAASSIGGAATHTVLVIDGSYSMTNVQGDESLFDQAKGMAVELVESARRGDGFTLVLMAEPPQTIIAEPGYDQVSVVREIDGLAARHAGAQLSATFAEVAQLLAEANVQHPRLTRKRVCVFTDLQRTTWEQADGAEFRRRIDRLADDASLSLYVLGEPERGNLAVTALTTQEAFVTTGRSVTFEAEVRNFSEQPQPQTKIEFLVDGRRANEQTIDAPPGGRAAASFSYPFDDAEEHIVEARISTDALELDNHRWLSVPVRESMQALCVRGSAEAARNVAYALDPTRGERPRVRTRTIWESKLPELDLSRIDCIFLCNVGRFSENEAGVLREYLQGGGGVVFVLGDRVQEDNYNRLLGGDADSRILPCQIGGAVSERLFHFDPLEYRHPIVAPFRGFERAGLLTTPIWRYLKLTPPKADEEVASDAEAMQVALAFDSGDPAIVEQRRFRGRVIVVATAASDESTFQTSSGVQPWTALASWPSFPPLIQEILALAASDQMQGQNVLVGQPLSGQAPRGATLTPAEVIRPDGQTEITPVELEDGEARWLYADTWQSGVWTVDVGQADANRKRLAVNLDTEESDLERIEPTALPGAFSPQTMEEPAARADTPALGAGRQEWFRPLLGLLLGLLFLESGLACRFGRHTA